MHLCSYFSVNGALQIVLLFIQNADCCYCPMEGTRLTQSSYSSRGVQPMPKAYRSIKRMLLTALATPSSIKLVLLTALATPSSTKLVLLTALATPSSVKTTTLVLDFGFDCSKSGIRPFYRNPAKSGFSQIPSRMPMELQYAGLACTF